ncbi:hypothetical protein I7I48_01521 [Histoplasma ohiense]|nr:hypothetical protein I7I48_01521 [Histoplasma ohiense (nom. inval.)]
MVNTCRSKAVYKVEKTPRAKKRRREEERNCKRRNKNRKKGNVIGTNHNRKKSAIAKAKALAPASASLPLAPKVEREIGKTISTDRTHGRSGTWTSAAPFNGCFDVAVVDIERKAVVGMTYP